ncbi:RHO1 GDP-GTP exchange protein 2 [Entomophthora muscae]|uniref:RHO1 GDP-GTP exchange protein 2 n=1 Tax=Entomophthora muscae TaxID=34485 RepID=A0ACC2SK39_9FUNG|nr:RHO1 GDP-GTP exchange protein 2 [Entomophthora muscae]
MPPFSNDPIPSAPTANSLPPSLKQNAPLENNTPLPLAPITNDPTPSPNQDAPVGNDALINLPHLNSPAQTATSESISQQNVLGPKPPSSGIAKPSFNPSASSLRKSSTVSHPPNNFGFTAHEKSRFRPSHASHYSFSYTPTQNPPFNSRSKSKLSQGPGVDGAYWTKPPNSVPAGWATMSSPSVQDMLDPLVLDEIDSPKLLPQGKLALSLARREFQFTRSIGAIEKLITARIQVSPIFAEECKLESINTILGNLPKLLTSHHRFVEDLVQQIKSNSTNYGKIFFRWIEGFTQFVVFAQSLPFITSYLRKAAINSPQFDLWLKDLERHPAFKNLSLVNLYKKIQNHLNDYPALLREIQEFSDDKSVMDIAVLAFEAMVSDIAAVAKSDQPAVIDPNSENWASAVSEAVRKSIDPQEIKRQEAIFEFIKAEREYVQDLRTIQQVFVKSIRSSQAFPAEQHDVVIHKLFFNAAELLAIHDSLLAELDARQQENAVVENIGDILLPWAQQLAPYKLYSARVCFALEFCTKERISNPKFELLLRECEQRKACRRLNLDSFISMPTRRLARYPLHLKEILKRTPSTNPDEAAIRETLAEVESRLSLIDRTKGETDSKLRLRAISDRLETHPQHQPHILDLDAPHRQLIFEGYLKLIKGSQLLKVFLFDHCILFCKEHELAEDLFEYETYRKPVELQHTLVTKELSTKVIQANMYSSFFGTVFSSNSAPSTSLCFSIFDGATRETLVFSASTAREKEDWVTLITNESDRVKSSQSRALP